MYVTLPKIKKIFFFKKEGKGKYYMKKNFNKKPNYIVILSNNSDLIDL